MATQIDLGAVVPIGKGDWNVGTTYERANIVRHNSVAWICKVESSIGVEPTEGSSDWYLLVKDTSSVTSINGQKGDVNLDIISPSQVDEKITEALPNIMVGASDEISGKSGLVPKPEAGDENKFLKGDGKWSIPAYLPLGHIFTWPFNTPPDGSIIANGSEYDRTLYNDLWTYISSKSDWVKTESEWQSIASDNNGYCPYYSDGNGSTTFRTPKFAPFQQLALSLNRVGTYHEAGLPDVQGDIALRYGANITGGKGAFSSSSGESQSNIQVTSIYSAQTNLNFSASDSNNTYGKSDTVQPESNEWIVCIVAYGKVTNVGNADVSSIMSAIDTTQSLVNEREKVNSSGDGWVRYESGLQMCWGFFVVDNTSYLTLPKPFIQRPYITFTVAGSATNGTYFVIWDQENSNESTIKAQAITNNNPGNLFTSYFAIGRWK